MATPPRPVCTHPGKRPGTRCQEPVVGVCTLCNEGACEKHEPDHFHVRRPD